MTKTYMESIDPLVKKMVEKLLDKEGEKRHWSYCSITSLMGMLKDEVVEAQDAIDECDPENLMEEVADIANFCMMIHDKLNQRLNN